MVVYGFGVINFTIWHAFSFNHNFVGQAVALLYCVDIFLYADVMVYGWGDKLRIVHAFSFNHNLWGRQSRCFVQ